MTTTLALARLDAPFGAELNGFSFAAADQVAMAAFRRALTQHHLLVCRGQESPDIDTVRRFFSSFGELTSQTDEASEHYKRLAAISEAFADNSGEIPELFLLSNVVKDGKQVGGLGDTELDWHNDQAYLPRLKKISMLEAIEVAPDAGPTYYCDMYSACENLPHELRVRLDEAMVLHDANRGYSKARSATSPTASSNSVPASPATTHPALKRHPDSGRRTLYVNPTSTDRIIGIARAESDELLRQLFESSYRPEYTYEHHWQNGDIVVWDNVGLQHRRDKLDPTQPRTLRVFQGVSEVLL